MDAEHYLLRMDDKRRTTWPVRLLEAAGLAPGDELVARAQAGGRVVVESREAVKRRIRERAARGRDRVGFKGSAADALLADRENDTSID